VITAFALLAILLSFVPFASSGAQALLINELLAHGGHGITSNILWFLILMIGASSGYDLLNSLRVLVNKRLWTNITEFFELIVLRKRSAIDVATYEDPKFNDLLGKTSEKGVWPICNLVENQFQQVTNVFQMATAALVFFVYDWRFFVLAVLAAMPDFIVELKYGKQSWDIWDEDSQTRRKYASVRKHFMSLSNLTELKIFQNAKKFYDLAAEMFRGFNNKQRQLDTKAFRWRVASDISSAFLQATIYVWIIYLVTHGHLKIGTMTFLLSSLSRFQGSLTGFFHNLAYQFEWALYASDVFKVLDTQPVITTSPTAICISDETPPLIEFRNVSFAYPKTDRLILQDINLTIPPGERLAIVGLNGAGKSTLIKLLMRFYDPTAGEILINGTDLRNVDRETWWHCIAALFQNYAEYNFPIREAVALGRSDGKGFLTKVVRSAKAADAHSFIVNLERRYDQIIGKEFDGGIDLSVGQSQKIALARSIYRDPRLMILDEPTASIDASAEAKIFEQLEQDAGKRTQIIISHRFSTVRRADRICVLQDGTITELGTHEELLAADKTYAKLFKLQAKGYE
jgi:ABC-type multidrug transport system fused ATPase/permease subunit